MRGNEFDHPGLNRDGMIAVRQLAKDWADRIEDALKPDCEPMSVQQFNQLLHMAVDKSGCDPAKMYVELTWWDGIFKPLDCVDCNNEENYSILVFGDTSINTFKLGKNAPIPVGFYVLADMVDVNRVIHRPMTVDKLIDNKWMADFETVRFLLCGSPRNTWIEIDPFKTKIYINHNSEVILSLYVDDRDSGEWLPFSRMTPDRIEVIDDGPKDTVDDCDKLEDRMVSDYCDCPECYNEGGCEC